MLKQSVGNPKTPDCNYNSTSGIYNKSVIEQIHYLKEENKMKNSFIQPLLFQNSSTIANNDLFRNSDNVDDTSPASNDDDISGDIEDAKDKDINDEDNNFDKKKYKNYVKENSKHERSE